MSPRRIYVNNDISDILRRQMHVIFVFNQEFLFFNVPVENVLDLWSTFFQQQSAWCIID